MSKECINNKRNNPKEKQAEKLNSYFRKEDTGMAKCMRRFSTSLVTRKIKIKTTMRCHYTYTRMAKVKYIDNTKFWQGHGARGILIHSLLVEIQNGTATL